MRPLMGEPLLPWIIVIFEFDRGDHRRNTVSTDLLGNDLHNMQPMEVAVNGPDGATHLILCTGAAN